MKKLAIRLQMKDGTHKEIWACARKMGERWQGGVESSGDVTWYYIYNKNPDVTIDAMANCITLDVREGSLIVQVNAKVDDIPF